MPGLLGLISHMLFDRDMAEIRCRKTSVKELEEDVKEHLPNEVEPHSEDIGSLTMLCRSQDKCCDMDAFMWAKE